MSKINIEITENGEKEKMLDFDYITNNMLAVM